MLVFRDGRRQVRGRALLEQFVARIESLPQNGPSSRELILDALVRAGELECALTDSTCADAERVAKITDAISDQFVSGGCHVPFSNLQQSLSQISPPPVVHISPPEGFAYYALHPLQFVDLTNSLPMSSSFAAVLGIRTIGTALSAVVGAGLRRRSMVAERTTVRPGGHPFDRLTEFTLDQRVWIARQRARSAEFLVVDEGPGLSGSSFLSVGDALLQAGVPRTKIAFLCGSQPDPGRLCARDAGVRWPQFRSYSVRPGRHLPPGAAADLSAGRWRERVFRDLSEWPASWIAMERAKFLSHDGRRFYKFEGLGKFGAAAYERAQALGAGGFSPGVRSIDDGYIEYEFVVGRPARSRDVSPALLDRIAAYCAYRAEEFRDSSGHSEDLESLIRCNLQEEFGAGTEDACTELEVRFPVLVDGRMLPHEWLLAANQAIKTDGTSHGDDHFFPGPTDIAWDLAGTIIEWELGTESADYFLRRYQELSGDNPRDRLPGYLQAYAAFRMGYCKMAAESMKDTAEGERLWREYSRYREVAKSRLPQGAAA
jgi:hypothetical protein